jgi:hypothetical protein
MAVRLAEQQRQQYKPNAMPDPNGDHRLMTPGCAHLTIIVVDQGPNLAQKKRTLQTTYLLD